MFGVGLNQIVNVPVINVIIPTNFKIIDAWVFDKIVAIQMTNNTFAFYEKTLVPSVSAKSLAFNSGSLKLNPNIVAFDMDVGS